MVPLGIFPHPDGKRTVMTPTVDGHAAELTELKKRGNDSVNIFEKDPMKYLVHKEQLRSSQMRAVNHEIAFMTNLQNLKQGLKSDYSDKQVLDTILGNSGFTDGLITEHLRSGPSGVRQQGKFLARDPTAYRDFIKASYQSKDQEDPFTHFFIKESGKIERVHKVHNDARAKFAHLAKDAPDKQTKEQALEVLKTLEDKVDDMLLENHIENEDIISLSHQVESEVKVEYNLKSLMKSEFVYDVDPDLVNADISDQAFLSLQRKRAETKLIKAKIIYKVSEGKPLTTAEKKYLNQWAQDIESNRQVNLLTVRDSMLPKMYS